MYTVSRTTILPVFCGCVTRSIALREEHKLTVFTHRVLRKMLVPNRK